eukprot:XP_015577455.2 cysteine-rich receptor-like protein kinase 19 isoform X1 [Ricinus communis]
MTTRIITLLIFVLNLNNLPLLMAKPWIKAAYYDSSGNLPASSVNSALFTHIYYGFAGIDNSTYQLSYPFSNEQDVSTFTATLKRKNPSIITLLSIGLAYRNYSTFSTMVSQPSYRKAFIRSSIKIARRYGFHGLDLAWLWPNTSFDMKNVGVLLEEWRAAVNSESRNSSEPQIILTMMTYRLPVIGNLTFPVESIERNLNWVNILTFDYHLPLKERATGNHAALYDPSGHVNTDFCVRAWLERGLPPSKLVLGLPYHGYAWTLVNPNDNSVGAPSSGPDLTMDGSIGYKMIQSVISGYGYGVASTYNATYAVNYFTIRTTWINFDDVEAIRTKISYAVTKGLLGYFVFQLANDDDWKLSRAAYGVGNDEKKKKSQIIIVLVPIVVVILLLFAPASYYIRCRTLKSRGNTEFGEVPSFELGQPITVVNEYPDQNAPNLQVFTFSEIKAATGNFCCENWIGEGGYGPVYKGKLPRGQEIAVKRLSKTSNQGLKEFKNELKLTAKLQHVNLVRLLGYCTERKEKMLIYEYMPNKSLDFYLFDQKRRLELNWEKRVHIIEGIAQGLLYLQEYSNLTIIHKDIKSSNILLDSNMKPKISDFGMARIFQKENHEANTCQIVGTYGYVPPEYVKRGVYSTKYDVYSFGVLLLQIISGKKNTCYYGSHVNLNLLEYAYEFWETGNGKEFLDPVLDDSHSTCKLLRCLQVGLLCVQESPIDRPSILQICSMLKNENDIIVSPKRPAFSVTSNDEIEKNVSKSTSQDVGSVNSASLSELLPR